MWITKETHFMMKKVLLFIPFTFALIGCFYFDPSSKGDVKFIQKSIDTYSLVDIMNPDVSPIAGDPQKIAEHSNKGAMTYYIHPNYPNVLYTTFEEYGKLLNSALPSTYQYSFSNNSIIVKDDDAKTVFDASLDINKSKFKFAGNLSLGSIGMDASSITGSLLADMKFVTKSVIEPPDTYSTIGYEVFARDFDLVVKDNTLYAPLALYDSVFASHVSAYHIYDFERVIQYNTNIALALPLGTTDGSVSNKLTAYHEQNGMPYDLRLLDKASLYQTLEYHYGLRDFRGISSVSKYFSLLGYDEKLIAENDDDRCTAYFDIFAGLNDDHSGVNGLASWFGDKKELVFRGQRSNERRMLKNSLSEQRNNALGTTPTTCGIDGNVYYSTSGKTAYFYFDSFIFDMKPYDPEHTDELWKSDTYFYFVHAFEEIKKHGGVENVIIDDSCNGGGTIGIAVKLLSLISKNNVGNVYQYDLLKRSLSELNCQVDSNHDGKYDADDVYGDDFDISILTSPVSFSCGNLLPVFAKYKGDAKIIGQTSGGGECTVASTYLPSGRAIQYSSNTILRNYEGEKIVRGVELGATPDIEIPYYQFYDIDALELALTK